MHVVPLCPNSAAGPPNKEYPVAGLVIVDCQQALAERINAFADLFALEHVPKKFIDFFDQNMLQVFESERFLFDQMIPSDREAL